MIAKMRKLHLAALSYDRDEILNTLERTRAAEIEGHEGTEGEAACTGNAQAISDTLARLENTLQTLVSYAEKRAAEQHGKGETPQTKDGFEVGYSEFMAAKEYEKRADFLMERVAFLQEELGDASAAKQKAERAIAVAEPYSAVKRTFSFYCDTKKTSVRFGTVPSSPWESVREKLGELPLADFEETPAENAVLVCVVCHKSVSAAVDGLLAAAGFSACPFTDERTGEQLRSSLYEELYVAEKRREEAETELFGLTEEIRPLKIYCDYVGFELEKAEASEKMLTTARTFLLEAFVPADEEEKVKAALDGKDFPLFYEFTDPAADEFVPTLTRNNKIVSNFETITNMYSPPNAREMDPNTVMSFFYSLFMGFIMADIGYGLVMMLGGGFLYWKNRKKEGGIKSLSGVFAVSGVFALIWGFLFNSLFGIAVLPYTVMPNVQTEMYTVMGIGLPAVLVISLMLGVVQLMAGYLCKAVQSWRRGGFWDGVFDGVVWAVFSLGVEFAIIGFVEEFNLSFLKLAGGIIAGASLLIAALTAGRKQKFLGKITKGFGSLYGLINYFSDVLSYLRLYALLLTGAIIAQVVSQYSIQFLTSGSWLVVLGPIVMVIGHLFNLAIGLLGAYIHTARLQYIEFFGKFYEGDGELFIPFGSRHKHVTVS